MRVAARKPPYRPGICRLIAAVCTLLIALLSASLLASGSQADLPGTYEGQAPPADAARRVFTLNLAADGTAMLTTVYIGKNNATERGRWARDGSKVVLTFDPMGSNGPPRPITFRYHGQRTQPYSLGLQ